MGLDAGGGKAAWGTLLSTSAAVRDLQDMAPQKDEFHTTSLPRKLLKGKGEWLAIRRCLVKPVDEA